MGTQNCEPKINGQIPIGYSDKVTVNVLMNASKFFLALMILFSGYIQIVVISIPGAVMMLAIVALVFLVLSAFKYSTPLSNGITVEISLWIAFAVTCLFVGYLISENQHYLIASITALIQYLVVIMMVTFISKHDGNLDFIVTVMAVLAIACSFTTVFFGVPYLGGSQISLSANLNPNSLGALFVFGIFALLYKFEMSNKMKIPITLFGILFIVYAINLTASRKSFIAALFLLFFWGGLTVPKNLKQLNFRDKTIVISIIFGVTLCFVYLLIPILPESIMMDRLSQLSIGDENRIGMYREAYQLFISSPFFGVGYNNFALRSVYGVYSHSTYAEVLACTGILGTFLYFSTYVAMGHKILTIVFNNKLTHIMRVKALNILAIFLVMLFLGTGMIHFYDLSSSLVFASIISFNKLNYKI